MPVSDTDVKAVYAGDGNNTTFAIPFVYLDASTIKVKLYEIATGIETVQTLTTHYTVVGSNVEFVDAPEATHKVIVYRQTPKTQPTTFIAGAFPATAVSNLFDKVVFMIQELGEMVDRCVQTVMGASSVLTTFPMPEANKFLAWDSSASSLVNVEPLDIVGLQTQITANTIAISSNDADISSLSSAISTLGSDLDALEVVDADHEARISQLETTYHDYGVRIGDVEAAVALLSDQSTPITNLQSAVTTLQNRATALENKDVTHTAAIASNTSRIEQLETVSYQLARRRYGSMAITNGASSTDVVGNLNTLLVNSSGCRSAEVYVEIERKTDDKHVFTSGRLILHFIGTTWYVIRDTTTTINGIIADDTTPDGVAFYVTTAEPLSGVYTGQVYFTSDTQAGANYSGTLRWLLQEMRLS